MDNPFEFEAVYHRWCPIRHPAASGLEGSLKEREQKRRVLFPIRLVPYDKIGKWKALDSATHEDLAWEVRKYFIPDFSKWKSKAAYKLAFEQLLKDLRA